MNLIICGDININYNDNNRNKIQLNSLLDAYNLQSIVDFPTRIRAHSSTTIDNIFIDKSKNINFTTEPYSDFLIMMLRYLFYIIKQLTIYPFVHIPKD
jgi:exonuclease III